MAGLALDFLGVGMRASEGEICPFMIKCLLCDRRNVLYSALVFGVASLAFALFLESSVQPLLLLDILPYIFVAIKAQGCLCGLIEAFVTFGAVFFPLSMAFNDLARHQGGFDILGPGIAYEERPQHDGDERHMSNEWLHAMYRTQYM